MSPRDPRQQVLYDTFDLFRSCYHITCHACGRELLTDDQHKRYRLVRDLVGEVFRRAIPEDWEPGTPQSQLQVAHYIDEVKRVAEFTCGSEHAGFISDRLTEKHLNDD